MNATTIRALPQLAVMNSSRAWTGLVLAALAAAVVSKNSFAQITNISINPEVDAFIRQAAPTNNYGRAGSLSVGGATATNGFGLLGGRTDSLARFGLSDVVTSIDRAFGNHDWFIASATVRLYELGAPNNALFSRGLGSYEIRWLANGNNWEEGAGSPNAPTNDGVAFQDLPSLTDPAHDLSLGIYVNKGVDGSLTNNLTLPASFAESLRSGGPVTLQFTPAGDSIGFTFLSRSDPRTDLRIALDLAIAAGPPPRIASISLTSSNQVTIRFDANPSWKYFLQFRDDLSSPTWQTLPAAPTQTFNGQAQFSDIITTPRRFYRLGASP